MTGVEPAAAPGPDARADPGRREDAARLGAALGELTDPGLSRARTRAVLQDVTALVARRAKVAGAGAITSGRFLADLLLDAAQHLPARDLDTLRTHHHGLQGEALADSLERSAARTTAVVGAGAGTLVAAQWFVAPTLVAVPLEILVETLVVALVEIKLLAELHAVYAVPLPRTGAARALGLGIGWAQRRAVDPLRVVRLTAAVASAGRTTVSRRILARFARNLGGLAPLLVGAAYGARSNSKETRRLAATVRQELRARRLGAADAAGATGAAGTSSTASTASTDGTASAGGAAGSSSGPRPR